MYFIQFEIQIINHIFHLVFSSCFDVNLPGGPGAPGSPITPIPGLPRSPLSPGEPEIKNNIFQPEREVYKPLSRNKK